MINKLKEQLHRAQEERARVVAPHDKRIAALKSAINKLEVFEETTATLNLTDFGPFQNLEGSKDQAAANTETVIRFKV